ncbi:uncharacterized protein LOC111365444 [Olea europaea var. sylvestris]|uniref:uncharacterized protein LOC111365444 n=1 Tax=Olea europaea var. sylvestris TaxID=158386 RepID=UPI000C1D23DD|nr:uncharacterized protein LOC111365444 [Olea europaea var. sylvestris]
MVSPHCTFVDSVDDAGSTSSGRRLKTRRKITIIKENYSFAVVEIVNFESRGECSRGNTTTPTTMMDNTDEEMSCMFRSRVRISDEEELQISLKVNVSISGWKQEPRK